MTIDGLRIRWGYDRQTRQVTARLDSEGRAECIACPPLGETEGVCSRVTELIDELVKRGAFAPEMRTIALDLSREQFENWGVRWESAA